jgi:HEAT repeat protein
MRILFFVLFVASFFCCVKAQLLYTNEPLNWLTNLNYKESQDAQNQATKAISKMGTNALPYLISELRDLGQPYNSTNFYSTGEDRLIDIEKAFSILGTNARPAIPELAELLNDGKISCGAAEILTKIDPKTASIFFSEAITNHNLDTRICVASYVVNLGTNAAIILPGLLECLNDKSPVLRSVSVESLGAINMQPNTVVPAIIEKLKDENGAVRFEAARALGKFGVNANAAISELSQIATNDPEKSIRAVATGALKQIQSR